MRLGLWPAIAARNAGTPTREARVVRTIGLRRAGSARVMHG
jgi:hypothetical protein